MSYLRLANSAIGWFFAPKTPYKFGIVALMCEALGIMDLALDKYEDSVSPTTDSMLRIVADMMWTIIIMFASLFRLFQTLTSPNA